MHIATSPLIRVDSRLALAAVALAGVVSTAFAQSTETLTIGFAQTAQVAPVALPLSAGLTAAIVLMLAATAFAILRRRAARGSRLFGWLLALAAGGNARRRRREARHFRSAGGHRRPGHQLSVGPGTLELSAY